MRELKTANRLNELLHELMALQEEVAKHEETQASAVYGAVRSVLWATIAGVMLVAIGLGLLLTASVTRPLGGAIAVLEGVAKGDLTKRADVQ